VANIARFGQIAPRHLSPQARLRPSPGRVKKLCRDQCPKGGWTSAKETCSCTDNFIAILKLSGKPPCDVMATGS
jgi:hypothetical protein